MSSALGTPEMAGGSGDAVQRPAKKARVDARAVSAPIATAADDHIEPSRPTRILEGLYIGADWDDADLALLRSHNIVAIINVSEEEQASVDPANIVIENFIVSDDADADIKRHFRAAFDFISTLKRT